MDTEGPVSVLDRRPRSSSRDRVIADRITRQRSPGPSFRHRNQKAASKTGSDEDDQDEVIYRIAQPYRTSFSAKHSVTWGKVDRSRSLSPTSSLRSNLSINSVPPMLKTSGDKRRPRGQSKSPKRVTYNSRVTVRTSDTEDSVFTELSSYEYDDDDISLQQNMSPFSRSIISPRYNEFSQLPPFTDTQKQQPHSDHRQHVKDITNLSYSSATDHSQNSRDSGLDYSAELRDLSDQISKMSWSLKHNRNTPDGTKNVPSSADQHYLHKHPSSVTSSSAPSPPGILKPSSDFHVTSRDRDRDEVFTRAGYEIFREGVNTGYSTQSSRSGQSWTEDESIYDSPPTQTSDQENGSAAHPFTPDEVDATPDTEEPESPGLDSDNLPQKDDVASSSPTDTSQGDVSPGRGSPIESGRLTPSKRSVSLSITNFLKRVSPHFRRKRSKDRNKKSSSAESSAQSLATTSDADTDQDLAISSGDNKKTKRPGRFSRNRVRQSFLKLVGSTGSKNKKKKKTAAESSHYTIEPQDPDKQTSSEGMDDISNGFISKSSEDIGTAHQKSCDSLDQPLRSSALNNGTLHDAHPLFKDENVHDVRYVTVAAHGHDLNSLENSLADTMYSPTSENTPTPVNSRMDFFTESDINAILQPYLDKPAAKPAHLESNGKFDSKGSDLQQRSVPPNSLDVMPARTKRLLQTSMMSSISGDESIGDCSLDANLTASEPSLLSGNSQSGSSRQVIIPNSLVNSVEGRISSEGESSNFRRTTTLKEEPIAKDSLPQRLSPQSRSDPSSPVDPSHKPSYLKLSCAVSGYGRYCSYSTYKDGSKRSNCSSQSSLRSDMSSPDPSLPAGEESTSESRNNHRPIGWNRFENKHSNQAATAMNGHVPSYPTGDTKKDGEYFLQHIRFEEERLKGFCAQTEVYIRSHDLPEEASGRVRAAIGKANLLVTQKFVQFRDLCHNHMQRSPDERETKWEDLQGFWDIVRIQIDNVDEMFAEIELMKQNGWQEVPEMVSKHSSANSSPRSGNVSQNSTPAVTPSHTPGSKRRNLKQNRNKNTPDSSPDEGQKAHQAIRARDEARKKLLSEKRAAMKQAAAGGGAEPEVEIFLQEPPNK